MKYMIEFRLKPGQKEPMLQQFEQIGPNRNPGVSFRDAWIGTGGDVIFALVEGDEAKVAAAAKLWSAHAEATLHPVVDVEQI